MEKAGTTEERIEKIEILIECLRSATPDYDFQACLDRALQAMNEAAIAYEKVL